MTDAPGRRKDLEQIEGRNPVLEALRGGRKVAAIFLPEGVEIKGTLKEILKLAEARKIPVERIERDEFARMSLTRSPQGVLAEVSPFAYADIAELEESFQGEEKPLVLVLDGVEDPQNFGSLLRVAEACGVSGVVIARRRSSPVTPAVAKASAGAVEHVRVARVANIASTLERLKEKGLWVVGADSESGEPYHQVDLSAAIALVLGSEGKGLKRLVKERCDFLVKLPMLGKVSSLNVSTAGAVLLYEALRQREERISQSP